MSVYEALTLVCSFATLLVALVALIVKLIEIKTKKLHRSNFGELAVLCTKILPPSFQRSTSESSCCSALFVSSLYQKQNELQTSPIQVIMSQ